MKERISKIMIDSALSATEFAERIGVGKPNISHILSGRNNPSLDIVMKILDAFPSIDMEWLLYGRGQMYKDQTTDSKVVPRSGINYQLEFNDDIAVDNKAINDVTSNSQLTSTVVGSQDTEESNEPPIEPSIINGTDNVVPPKVTDVFNENMLAFSKLSNQERKITKIIIYYSDNSFSAFNPSETSL